MRLTDVLLILESNAAGTPIYVQHWGDNVYIELFIGGTMPMMS
jgi:hypothetical protein